MRQKTLYLLVAGLTLLLGVSVDLLWRRHVARTITKPQPITDVKRDPRSTIKITAVGVHTEAPLAISSVSRKTVRVATITLTNVSDHPIQAYRYLYEKKCENGSTGGGGGTTFVLHPLQPGQETIVEVGVEDGVTDLDIQRCVDNAKEMHLQITEVEFADGTVWTLAPTANTRQMPSSLR